METYLGIDLGTSSLKIIAGDINGKIIGKASSSFKSFSIAEGYSEEKPDDWQKALDSALRKLLLQYPRLKKTTKSIAFSGQMHSLVLIDKDGNALRDAILWNDARTREEVAFLNEKYGETLLLNEKNYALDGFTLPKIVWVKKHQPEIWKKTWKFMLPKDYLIFYLTGNVFTDSSDAAGTILFKVEKQEWDEELLTDLEIEKEKCPPVLYSNESAGLLLERVKKMFGFEQEVAIVMGGADNACGALGNLSSEKQTLISVGTSGVVLTYSNDASEQSRKYHYFNSALPNKNYKMGVTLSAGYSLDWFKNIMAPDQNFSEFTAIAENSSVGSNGVLFLPYLFGERSPYFNTKMSAEFIGLKAMHQKSDMIRAVMEGVAFSLKNVYENMGHKNEKGEVFRITGGVVNNSFWVQIFADIFESKIEVLEMDEGPAFGALICAINYSEGLEQETIFHRFNKVKKIYLPNANNFSVYREVFTLFKKYSQKNYDESIL